MVIHEENIELLLFEYLEGELSQEEQQELLRYVEHHPEHKTEMEHWRKTYAHKVEAKDYGLSPQLVVQEKAMGSFGYRKGLMLLLGVLAIGSFYFFAVSNNSSKPQDINHPTDHPRKQTQIQETKEQPAKTSNVIEDKTAENTTQNTKTDWLDRKGEVEKTRNEAKSLKTIYSKEKVGTNNNKEAPTTTEESSVLPEEDIVDKEVQQGTHSKEEKKGSNDKKSSPESVQQELIKSSDEKGLNEIAIEKSPEKHMKKEAGDSLGQSGKADDNKKVPKEKKKKKFERFDLNPDKDFVPVNPNF